MNKTRQYSAEIRERAVSMVLGKRRGWDSNPQALARAGFQDRFLSQFGHPSRPTKMAPSEDGFNGKAATPPTHTSSA